MISHVWKIKVWYKAITQSTFKGLYRLLIVSRFMQIYTMYLEISGNTNLCIFHNLNKGLFLLFRFIDTMFCYYTKIDSLLINNI